MKNITKWFDNENGYGFIEYKDDGNICVHYLIRNKSRQEECSVFEFIKTDDGIKLKEEA